VEFTTAAFTYEAESGAWERAYWELDGKFKDALSGFDIHLKNIDDKHREAISDWERELRKSKRREHLPGFGVFAGAGYAGGSIEITYGVGLVWKIF
jgi:hypothetical protein